MKGIFEFCRSMQEYIFAFLELNDAENKSACKCVGNVFLMIKLGPG
jgi:hypothetical protein